MIPLAEPIITEQDKAFVIDALESGWINTSGEYINMLSEELCKASGCSYAVPVVNGTSGLFMALKALRIGPGDKVIVPSITFIASVNAIVHTGAEPIFADCDDSLNIDTNKLKEFLDTSNDSSIKAIMPVHIFGNPCEMDSIISIANKHGLFVVEDACEALGSKYKDKYCGGIGDIGVYSFSFNKMITSGNGGAIVTNNKKIADKIRYWITQSKDDPENYIHNEVGYNLGLTNIQAALGYSQILRLPEIIKQKQKNIKQYNSLLKHDIFYYQEGNGWFVGYITINKNKIVQKLKEEGIQTRQLWTPNHLQKPFKSYSRIGNLKVSEYYGNNVINLPCGINLTEEQINHICEIIIKEDC